MSQFRKEGCHLCKWMRTTYCGSKGFIAMWLICSVWHCWFIDRETDWIYCPIFFVCIHCYFRQMLCVGLTIKLTNCHHLKVGKFLKQLIRCNITEDVNLEHHWENVQRKVSQFRGTEEGILRCWKLLSLGPLVLLMGVLWRWRHNGEK